MEKKIELINEIIRVYDENETLKRELEKTGSKELILKEENNQYDILNSEGRKKLFNEVFYSWSFPTVLVDEESKDLVFLNFEQWIGVININVINRKEYLSHYSLEQLKDYFRKELEELYNKLKMSYKEKETQEKEE